MQGDEDLFVAWFPDSGRDPNHLLPSTQSLIYDAEPSVIAHQKVSNGDVLDILDQAVVHQDGRPPWPGNPVSRTTQEFGVLCPKELVDRLDSLLLAWSQFCFLFKFTCFALEIESFYGILWAVSTKEVNHADTHQEQKFHHQA